MNHSAIPYTVECNMELSESEALAIIESMPKNFISDTPGIYLDISVDYKGYKDGEKYKFSDALGHIAVTKNYLETTWATAIITTTSNRYHNYHEEDDTQIRISTDVHFEVYTIAFPNGVEYDEHHEITFTTEDVL